MDVENQPANLGLDGKLRLKQSACEYVHVTCAFLFVLFGEEPFNTADRRSISNASRTHKSYTSYRWKEEERPAGSAFLVQKKFPLVITQMTFTIHLLPNRRTWGLHDVKVVRFALLTRKLIVVFYFFSFMLLLRSLFVCCVLSVYGPSGLN